MIPISIKAQRTHNPIRSIVDNLKPPIDHPDEIINLSLGDPTAYGNLKTPTCITSALSDAIMKQTCNGYIPR